MDQRDLLGEIGQIQGFLDSCVAPTHDRDMLVAEEKAVARGAGGDAHAGEFLLGFEPQPLRLRTGRDDQAVRTNLRVPAISDELEGAFSRVMPPLANVVGDEIASRLARPAAHLLHHQGP